MGALVFNSIRFAFATFTSLLFLRGGGGVKEVADYYFKYYCTTLTPELPWRAIWLTDV